MLTLTFIAWLLGIISAVIALRVWGIEESDDINKSAVLPMLIISLMIGGGIQYDINGEVTHGIPLWFVSGLVFLGLNALLIMLFMLLHSAKHGVEFSSKGVISVIFSLVGFVSSVLGIISFYLDHLR